MTLRSCLPSASMVVFGGKNMCLSSSMHQCSSSERTCSLSLSHFILSESYVISRFKKKGFNWTGLKLFWCSRYLADEHYKDLKAKSFFPKLIEYITSGLVGCMGVGVVASAHKLIGSIDPLQAESGTIRGDLECDFGSDRPENGKHEIALWFKEGEICQWTSVFILPMDISLYLRNLVIKTTYEHVLCDDDGSGSRLTTIPAVKMLHE
ncbi:hypothetical protein UlMin_042784 [Ulmus minor]